MGRILKVQPTHWLYILVHLVLIIVGFLIIVGGGPLFDAIGTSLVAAGMSGWIIFVYVLASDDVRAKIRLIARIGFSDYFSSRGSSIRAMYDDRLNLAKDRIDAIGFGLKALREDHLNSFVGWKAKAKIRILLLDPEFPTAVSSLAVIRDGEENQAAGTISDEVKEFVRQTRTLVDERFQIRLARCIPSVNLFRIDDELFWGPYLAHKVSRNSPTFLVRRDGELFRLLMEHFETIWGSRELSREVPAEWNRPQ
jgi:hypothetical protein